jgi:hypothetical protein
MNRVLQDQPGQQVAVAVAVVMAQLAQLAQLAQILL